MKTRRRARGFAAAGWNTVGGAPPEGLPAEGVPHVVALGRSTAQEHLALSIVEDAHAFAQVLGLDTDDLVPAPAQGLYNLVGDALLDGHPQRVGLARVEGGGKVYRVNHGRIERELHVHPEFDDIQEELERCLVLGVAALGAKGQHRLAVAGRQGRASAWPAAACEAARALGRWAFR